jgi:hypothetical protein
MKWLAFLFALFLEELVQLVMPNRTFSLADLACSLAGVIILGGIGGHLAIRRSPSCHVSTTNSGQD